MVKKDFILLLKKYKQGSISPEEQRFLERYYDLFQHDADVLALFSPEERERLGAELSQQIWNNIYQQSLPEPASRRLHSYRFVIGMAAALLLALGIWWIIEQRQPVGTTEAVPELAQKTNPTPVAEKNLENRMVFLPDGSQVMLSANSKLNYPSSFDGLKKREVFLDGEAFFDVKHNPGKPFVVHTGNVATTVLGTAFNVKANHEDVNIVVTVKRGKVRVSDRNKVLGVITPNQQIRYDKQKVVAIQENINSDSYLEWQRRNLIIDNLTISEAARLMGERYNVEVIVNSPEVESLRFSTTFPKDVTLEQMLKTVCLFNNLAYRYSPDGSRVYIDHKKTTN
ncbi:MAG: FecR domain-containing protein [Bacteroidetes bacterium]|nr:FecR domain-containing protein [Bacteroidota bacterium]